MSNQHSANQIPEMTREEHSRIGGVDGKHVFVFDASGNQITGFGSNTPTTLINGMVSCASGGLTQFPTNSIQWVTVKSSLSNPTTVYLGASGATINNGFSVEPGDMIGFAINNTNNIYLVGVGQTEVRFVGGN